MERIEENMDHTRKINGIDTSTRGFASMDPERQRQIAREGGKAAHEKGTAHEFDSNEAREAGRKGGEAVSRNRTHGRNRKKGRTFFGHQSQTSGERGAKLVDVPEQTTHSRVRNGTIYISVYTIKLDSNPGEPIYFLRCAYCAYSFTLRHF